MTLAELQGAADAITKLYLEGGYLTSRAVLGEQVARDGVITIQVLEGRLEDIRIEGNKGIIQRYIRSRIALGAGVPLNSNRLEEQLRLLRTDPLFANLSASLRPARRLKTVFWWYGWCPPAGLMPPLVWITIHHRRSPPAVLLSFWDTTTSVAAAIVSMAPTPLATTLAPLTGERPTP